MLCQVWSGLNWAKTTKGPSIILTNPPLSSNKWFTLSDHLVRRYVERRWVKSDSAAAIFQDLGSEVDIFSGFTRKIPGTSLRPPAQLRVAAVVCFELYYS